MKNKKVIIFLIALFGVASIFMITMAYSHDDAHMGNEFAIGDWKTVFTEEFSSPSDWITCETIDKTITVKNEADADASVRIIIEEQWIGKDGNILPLTSTYTGNRLAQINFATNSGWTEKPGGYYYYDANLQKNEITSSLITGVTLNCEANLDEDVEYGGATYHLKATAQTIQADRKTAWHYSPDCGSNVLYDTIACQTNGLDTGIDFTTPATASNNNGQGVNTFAAKSEEYYPVYYYRGEINNNYVVWGGECWRAVRTTTDGGVKLFYSGGQTDGQCLAAGSETAIEYNGETSFPFNRVRRNPNVSTVYYRSPAFSGYMYGEMVLDGQMSVAHSKGAAANDPVFYISDDVTRNGNRYTLSGDVVMINWNDKTLSDVARRHYICTNRQNSCNSSDIGYVSRISKSGNTYFIFYLKIGGYDNIEAAKQAMFSNDNDSSIKTVIEGWFEAHGLSDHEEDLEDAIYCNDRTIAIGSLGGSNSVLGTKESGVFGSSDWFGAFYRVRTKNAENNYSLTLDCANKNDAFTKLDTANGNGKLAHKVGLITADEVTLAGTPYDAYRNNVPGYLKETQFWTMSPKVYSYGNESSDVALLNNGIYYQWDADDEHGGAKSVHPVVTLKAGMKYTTGADGTNTNPYVIE